MKRKDFMERCTVQKDWVLSITEIIARCRKIKAGMPGNGWTVQALAIALGFHDARISKADAILSPKIRGRSRVTLSEQLRMSRGLRLIEQGELVPALPAGKNRGTYPRMTIPAPPKPRPVVTFGPQGVKMQMQLPKVWSMATLYGPQWSEKSNAQEMEYRFRRKQQELKARGKTWP